MSFSNLILTCAAFGALACFAQVVEVVPDIAMAEAEYRDANEAWLRNDPNLERELFTAEPEQVRHRIHQAAALQDDVMAKKEVYLTAVIKRLDDMRGQLGTGDTGKIPADELKKGLARQQDRTLDEEGRLDGLLHDLPQSDEYLLVRRALEEERAGLVSLQNNIAMRIRSLESLGKTQQAVENAPSADALKQKLDAVIKLWGQERDSIARERAHWASLYQTMEKAVDKKEPARPAKRKGAALNPPDSVTPAGGRTVAVAGTWVYKSQPGAWTGYGEPEAVTLELSGQGDNVQGTYTARLPVRRGVHTVELWLTGPYRAGRPIRLHWTSQTPETEGEMELQLSADGRLLVERAQSGDAYIPCGMEVLRRR